MPLHSGWPDITQCSKASSPTSPNCWRCQRAVPVGSYRGSHHGRGHRPHQRRVQRCRRGPGDRLRESPQGAGGDRPDPQLAALHRARGTRDGAPARAGYHRERALGRPPRGRHRRRWRLHRNPAAELWTTHQPMVSGGIRSDHPGGRPRRLRHRCRRSLRLLQRLLSRCSSPAITARPVRNAPSMGSPPSNSSTTSHARARGHVSSVHGALLDHPRRVPRTSLHGTSPRSWHDRRIPMLAVRLRLGDGRLRRRRRDRTQHDAVRGELRGPSRGGEGVKLEEQILITETGIERLSVYGYDERLLGA